ncbi:MAG: hypothetical protein IMW99_04485 [Firmicutes bacterium]|nr:hypothetical protein [Bacillota bacterium]
MNELDPLLISRILQGRILTVAGSQWQLNVLHLVLGERVRVFLSIKPVEPPAKPGIGRPPRGPSRPQRRAPRSRRLIQSS